MAWICAIQSFHAFHEPTNTLNAPYFLLKPLDIVCAKPNIYESRENESQTQSRGNIFDVLKFTKNCTSLSRLLRCGFADYNIQRWSAYEIVFNPRDIHNVIR